MNPYTNHFRPIYEIRAALGWSLAAVFVLFSGIPHAGYFALLCLTVLLFRSTQVWRALKFRLAISTKWLTVERIDSLLAQSQKLRSRDKDEDAMYLGTGYEWTQKHCQLAHDILRMPSTDIPGLPKWLPKQTVRAIEKAFAPGSSIADRSPQGKPWIAGLESTKHPIPFHYKAMGGHTSISGTTGAGKTRTFEIISTQVIHNPNDVLIVIDPKNDPEWVARCRRECERTGRKFLYWKQAAPSQSIRLNPLENWSQPSEIPTRIAQLMEEGPFRQFAFLFIDRSVKGELYVGDKPNLRSILQYAQNGINNLLERALQRFFPEAGKPDWDEEVAGYMQQVGQKGGGTRLDAMVRMYIERFANVGNGHESIDGLISTFQHDRDHYGRIIASALPLLQMLATGETGLMLAPKADDFHDDREIWDIDKVIKQKAVLYVGADSLSNSMVAQAVMSMLLADIASVAGAIYNFYAKPPEIVIQVDEAAEAINEQLLQLLNKGRGAGFKAFIAYQTRSDFTAKLGNVAKMNQVLGNLNNQIVLRLEDIDTAQWFAEKAGTTAIRNLVVSSSTSTGTEAHVGEFTGSVSRSAQLEKVPLIPHDLLMQLPNLQFFLRISGGAVYQGRIPIIQD
ncbi:MULTISPECIES: conjugative transfer system coupling protein TraD [unclassified Cupriavidus]|uniref:conjugative transfer system coupling protein TraD n=1 Tax=unclassified Cupriavidus TaxID=2640874 RepID=UPI0010F7A124|nr:MULTISPECIES: conjugative transfer system coupling protein TraD [unclassified Cupriavidus]MWL92074.1 conjugative transfer system coupling protein TraD [Cupriavidus sp. SW-Y-13]